MTRQTFAIGDTIRQAHLDAVEGMEAENERLRGEVQRLCSHVEIARDVAHSVGYETGYSAAIVHAARVADEHYAEIGRASAHHLREGNEDSLGRCHARQRSASQIAAAIRQLGRE